MAEGQDELPDPQAVGVAQRQDGKPPGAVDLHQGQVHAGVLADQRSLEAPPVLQAHLDARGVGDDVGVRHEEPVLADQEPRARRAPRLIGRARLVPLAGRRLGPLDPHLDEPALQALGELTEMVVEPGDLGGNGPGRSLLPERAAGRHAGRAPGEQQDCHDGKQASLPAHPPHPSLLSIHGRCPPV